MKLEMFDHSYCSTKAAISLSEPGLGLPGPDLGIPGPGFGLPGLAWATKGLVWTSLGLDKGFLGLDQASLGQQQAPRGLDQAPNGLAQALGEGEGAQWTDGRLKIHPCVLQDIDPLRPLPEKGHRLLLKDFLGLTGADKRSDLGIFGKSTRRGRLGCW